MNPSPSPLSNFKSQMPKFFILLSTSFKSAFPYTTPSPLSNLQSQMPKFFILLSTFFLLLSAACSRKPAPPPPPPPPPIHDLVLKNLASEFPGEIRTADFAGQVQLIVFLRTDDPACRATLPEWNALQHEFAPRAFTLVGAVVDDRPPADLAAEAAPLGIAFPLGLADAPIVAAFGGTNAIRAIPTAFLLSRTGTLLRTYSGFIPPATLRADLATALETTP